METLPSPVLSGALHEGRVYFGSKSGAIFIFDAKTRELVRTIEPQPGRFDISHIVLGVPGPNDAYMAFRREDEQVKNW